MRLGRALLLAAEEATEMYHKSTQAQPAGSGDDSGRRRNAPDGWLAVLDSASQACCCPARPAVAVVMPPAPGRPRPVDLLLCRHHYRVSQQALATAGAVIIDPEETPAGPDAVDQRSADDVTAPPETGPYEEAAG